MKSKGKKENQFRLFIYGGAMIIVIIVAFFLIKKYIIRQNSVFCKDCNVLLISLDTLSANHLPCYGYERDTAPNLCKFANKNIFFTNSFAPSHFTLTSHFSIFTSLYPSTHRVLENLVDELNPKYMTLVQILKKYGYTTHFFGGTKNINLPLDKGLERGFSEFHDGEYLGKNDFDYAFEKFISEAKKRKFKLTIIRLPTVWGENPRRNAFLNFLRNLANNNSVFSRLNWPGKVALINVEDAAKFILDSAKKPARIISIATENLTLAQIFEKIYLGKGKTYKGIKVPNLIWKMAKFLRPYLKYFEFLLPINIYNYLWRASIVTDSPLSCKINMKGNKFTG